MSNAFTMTAPNTTYVFCFINAPCVFEEELLSPCLTMSITMLYCIHQNNCQVPQRNNYHQQCEWLCILSQRKTLSFSKKANTGLWPSVGMRPWGQCEGPLCLVLWRAHNKQSYSSSCRQNNAFPVFNKAHCNPEANKKKLFLYQARPFCKI